ncbi:low temperature requirement protein A [Nonomuraea sp. NPDC005983]|uniref:low temperature requirement protein A n=1 Tax=Nonomuraea sp. NPDC005983 TaxID=3155595 RepID=UPI00339F85F1
MAPVIQSRRPEHLIAQLQAQADRMRARDLRRGLLGRPAHEIGTPKAAVLDPAHLGERLGLFVIIVLGEAVMQVVLASSGRDWDWPLGLIVSLWWLTLRYGLSAVPEVHERGLRPRVALPAHFAMAAGITATVAGRCRRSSCRRRSAPWPDWCPPRPDPGDAPASP